MDNKQRAENWQRIVTLAYMARDAEREGFSPDKAIAAAVQKLLNELAA